MSDFKFRSYFKPSGREDTTKRLSELEMSTELKETGVQSKSKLLLTPEPRDLCENARMDKFETTNPFKKSSLMKEDSLNSNNNARLGAWRVKSTNPFKRSPLTSKYVRNNVKEVNKMKPRTLFPIKEEPKISFKSLKVNKISLLLITMYLGSNGCQICFNIQSS